MHEEYMHEKREVMREFTDEILKDDEFITQKRRDEVLLQYEPEFQVEQERLFIDTGEEYQSQSVLRKNVKYDKKRMSVDELLFTMFPPQQYFKEGQAFQKNVSIKDLERHELDALKRQLLHLLTERKAKKRGLCKVKKELHYQLFDEIIRQCTLNCPERGLLLMRCRDDLKMTIESYKTLYEGSVIFGIRKHCQAIEGIPELEQKVVDLEFNKDVLVNKKLELEEKLKDIKRSFKEADEYDADKRKKQVDFNEQLIQKLKDFIETQQYIPEE